MKHLLTILFCFILIGCSQKNTESRQQPVEQVTKQISKEEKLFNLLSDKIIDSIGGETERGETLSEIENLIKNGVDVNARDRSTFQTPIMVAVQYGRPSALRLLLKAGANTNLQDDKGRTALMGAAQSSDVLMVKLLLEHGAKIDIEDNNGHTALTGAQYADGDEKYLEPQEKNRYLEIQRMLKKNR